MSFIYGVDEVVSSSELQYTHTHITLYYITLRYVNLHYIYIYIYTYKIYDAYLEEKPCSKNPRSFGWRGTSLYDQRWSLTRSIDLRRAVVGSIESGW